MNLDENLDNLIQLALREDIGDGDHSTLACIPPDAIGTAKMVAKQDGILCGAEVGKRVFTLVDPSLKVTLLKNDGDNVMKGDLLMLIEGPSGSILTAERTALNYMQRLSGIATETHRMVLMLDNFDVDTLRKAVIRIDGKYETEASGGITDLTLRKYAETGVDFISVGALTHHIKSMDISLVKN